MAQNCAAPLWAEVVRITKLDQCGRPQYGPCSQVVTDSYTEITRTREIEEGADFTKKKANGKICRSLKQPDSLKWWTWEIAFCAIDPSLLSMMNDNILPVRDYLGNISGWQETYDIASNSCVAVETWLELDQGELDVCEQQETAQGAWGYDLLPRICNARIADELTYGEDFEFRITGISRKGVKWGKGPYNVVLNPGTPPQPGPLLENVVNDAADYFEMVTVPPPEPSCGCQPLSNPNAPQLTVVCSGNGMVVTATADTSGGSGEWMIDFGDGTDPAPFTGTAEHTYAAIWDSQTVTVGIWDSANANMYRALQLELPCEGEHTTPGPINPNTGVVLDPTSVPAGGTTTVTLSNFTVGGTGTVSVLNASGGVIASVPVTINDQGGFTGTLEIPAGTTPGTYRVVTEVGNDLAPERSLTVTGPSDITVTVTPDSGPAPLSVVATVTGDDGTGTMDWGDGATGIDVSIAPDSGDAPLNAVATVTGDDGTGSMTWGDEG